MATNDKTAEDAEATLRGDIASVMTEPASTEEVPVASEKPEAYEIYGASAKDAIEYIRKREDVSEIYDLIQAEEQGKGRKTIITEGMSRIQELNILKEQGREEALAPPTADLTDSDGNADTAIVGTVVATEAAVEPPPAADTLETEEYPIEDSAWDGEVGRYTEVKHISRTMHPMGGLDDRVMSPRNLNDYLEEHFAQGFELIEVLPQGFGPDGVSILYVLGKVQEYLEAEFTSIWHIQRTLTERPMQTGGITGFQADKYLNSFLSEGWQLIAAKSLKEGESEIPMLWVLVR